MRGHTSISLFVALAVTTSGCSQLESFGFGERPRVRDVRARVTGIDFDGITLSVDVDVQNPYSVAIRTPSFRYGLDIEDSEFINSTYDTKVDLPARQLTTVTLPVRLEYKKLWATYQRLSAASEVSYSVHGTFLLNAMGNTFELPIRHTGKFPVLRLPSFTPGNVRTSEASLTGAKVQLDATVTNPNAFALGCNNMSYTLRLGEVEVGRVTASTPGKIEAGRSGNLTLSGQITGLSALRQIIAGKSLGKAKIFATGSIQTPYGEIPLPDPH